MTEEIVKSLADSAGLDVVPHEAPTKSVREELEELRRLVNPTFALMADVHAAMGDGDPFDWPNRISDMRKDSERYKRLIQRLIEGECTIRGVHFIRLEDDLITKKEFDAELD